MGPRHLTNPQVHGTKWSSSPSGEETPQGFTAYRTPRPGGSPLSLVRNFGNDLGRSFEDCYLLLGFLGNPRHEEMFIESQSCLDAEPFHHCERGTICERIRFIRMLNEGNSSKTPATYLHASSNSVSSTWISWTEGLAKISFPISTDLAFRLLMLKKVTTSSKT